MFSSNLPLSMVNHHKEVYYRHGFWHLNLTYKTKAGCQIQWMVTDLFWQIWPDLDLLDLLVAIWTNLDQFGPFFDQFGPIWNYYEPLGPIWTHLDLVDLYMIIFIIWDFQLNKEVLIPQKRVNMQITQILLQAWTGFFSVCIVCSNIHLLVMDV